MDSTALLLALRLVHIIAGAAWVGSAVILVLVILPMARRHGLEGTQTLQRLVNAGLTRWMASTSGLAVLAGLILYARDSRAAGAGWSQTPAGMTLGIGGALGFVGAVVGGAYLGRAGKKLAALGDQVGSADAAPARALAERQLWNGGIVVLVLVILSTASMSIARYL